MSRTLPAEERWALILAALSLDGSIRLQPTSDALGVSIMTVRRDLDELAAAGKLRRVRGGAVKTAGPRPFVERREVHLRAKQVIAEKAKALIPAAGAIAFDASSTAGTIAASLRDRQGLTIATNSYDNFSQLNSTPGLTAVLVGGEREPTTGSFVGMLACEAASAMLYRRLFASATAVDAAYGSSEVSLPESQVKRAFAARCREIVLCVDSSKLGEQSVVVGFPFSEIAVMITELDPADARLSPYRSLTELR